MFDLLRSSLSLLIFLVLRSAPTPLKESLTLPTKIYSLAYAPTTRTLIVSMANRKVFVYNLDINELKSNLSSGQGGLGKPQQERESALKFMTRSVAVMADGQGELCGHIPRTIIHHLVHAFGKNKLI
jgi:cell cycle arrest protein BUB3